jgi:hypothetical protein
LVELETSNKMRARVPEAKPTHQRACRTGGIAQRGDFDLTVSRNAASRQFKRWKMMKSDNQQQSSTTCRGKQTNRRTDFISKMTLVEFVR